MSTSKLASDHAAKTYRYLRIGILGATAMLLASVSLEMIETKCFLTSISAYYYTAARPVFVGALLAIGLALITIKGDRKEDLALNVAGMLAPVVALVPIRSFDKVGNCLVRDPLRDADPEVLEAFLDLSVGNNMSALLWAGVGGLVVTVVVLFKGRKTPSMLIRTLRGPRSSSERESLVDLILFASLAAVFASWFAFLRVSFIDRAHLVSAGGMFVALAVAALVCSKYASGWHRKTYRWIGIAMIVSIPVLALSSFVFNWWILVLELIEIALFAAFWAVQTIERWDEKVVATPSSQPG
jgi:hypothetical protein